jgi:hydroxymethylpyrimidine/phosphomethylpyrimidine kinase
MKNVLTVAGSDSCGGAGIQADIKTFCALGTYGMSVITAVTAQNTRGVALVREMDTEIIKAQIDCIFSDINVDAVKIGMVSSAETIETVAESLKRYHAKNIVLDPVMISKNGYHLLKTDAKEALIKKLFPLSLIVTPNIPEAEEITGRKIANTEDMKEAAKYILKLGPASVYIKGGHLSGDAVDVFYDGKKFSLFCNERINTKNTHGTGCTFSSAVAALTARGFCLDDALSGAKMYITSTIAHSLSIGAGAGPTNHFYGLYKAAGMDTD